MNTSEIYLIAMIAIFTVPYLIWRLGNTDYWAPLVVVQIVTGILLGPGVMGAAYPDAYKFVFNPAVITALNGVAWWAVMLFVWIAGIELDLHEAWKYRRESGITAGLALGTPLVLGCVAALAMITTKGWIGANGRDWQFVLGVGMSCAVTALPILILFMEKLEILRQPIGQRILRYASLDDVAIWGVLALILLDWDRVTRQVGFLIGFAVATIAIRKLMQVIAERDRWYVGMIWLAVCGFAADWSGLHFMVGAFLSGAVLDGKWFDQKQMDMLRHHVRSAHQLGNRRDGSVHCRGLAAGRLRDRQAGGHPVGWPDPALGAGRGVADRLAAADEGTDHDHLRQHPARQENHHR